MTELNGITDQRVTYGEAILTPKEIYKELPISNLANETIKQGRRGIENILNGNDSRKFLIVGPCSIHDPEAARDYASRFEELSNKVSDKLLLIMRTYFEKPRTTIGWKGLINDPNIDGTYDINNGYRTARKLLLDIAELGVHTGTEYLESISPQLIGTVAWAVIGARTVESPQHRQLASGLSMPVGFKNSTDGGISVAVNAVIAAKNSQSFYGINQEGISVIVHTMGNPYTHIVLRGGGGKTNYDKESVSEALNILEKNNLPRVIVMDASHDNTFGDNGKKDYNLQPQVIEEISKQIKDGNNEIVGSMIESNINAGTQTVPSNLEKLKYGVSITDGCIDWSTTENLILDFHKTLSTKLF